MKEVICSFILACLFYGHALAQVPDLDRFYQPGTAWGTFAYEYHQLGLNKHRYSQRKYSVIGDSMVSGQKVYLIQSEIASVQNTIGYIRIDNQKVYFTNTGSDTIVVRWPYRYGSLNRANTILLQGTEHLLYDYDIKQGDTLHWKIGYQEVLRVDSVYVNGLYLRRFSFYGAGPVSGSALGQEYWIEGIGSNLGFFGSLDTPWSQTYYPLTYTRIFNYCAPDLYYHIGFPGVSLYDGKCNIIPLGIEPNIAKGPAITIFPNPSGPGTLRIKAEGSALISRILIRDMYGRQVLLRDLSPAAMALEIQPMLHTGIYVISILLTDGQVMIRQLQRN